MSSNLKNNPLSFLHYSHQKNLFSPLTFSIPMLNIGRQKKIPIKFCNFFALKCIFQHWVLVDMKYIQISLYSNKKKKVGKWYSKRDNCIVIVSLRNVLVYWIKNWRCTDNVSDSLIYDFGFKNRIFARNEFDITKNKLKSDKGIRVLQIVLGIIAIASSLAIILDPGFWVRTLNVSALYYVISCKNWKGIHRVIVRHSKIVSTN